jgi:hypothetical protein
MTQLWGKAGITRRAGHPVFLDIDYLKTITIFRSNGLARLRIIAKSEGHPGAKQIYEQIRADFPTGSLATIYNILTLLQDMGEVLEFTLANATSLMMAINHFRTPMSFAPIAAKSLILGSRPWMRYLKKWRDRPATRSTISSRSFWPVP